MYVEIARDTMPVIFQPLKFVVFISTRRLDFLAERWYNRGMDKRDRTMEYHSHCDRGHEWTEENTYTMPSGTKICYACNRSTNWGKAGFPDVFYKFYEFPDAVYTGLDPL